jgi:hypothetical protein
MKLFCPIYEKDIKYDYIIVGMPSGEVFEINGLQLYNLYENDLIEFNYVREFWCFKDRNVERIKMRIK